MQLLSCVLRVCVCAKMNKTCARCQKVVYPIEELKCLDKVSSCLQFVFISIRHRSSFNFSRPPLLCYCYSCFCRRRCCLCSLPIFGSCEFVYTDVFVCGLCVCAVRFVLGNQMSIGLSTIHNGVKLSKLHLWDIGIWCKNH